MNFFKIFQRKNLIDYLSHQEQLEKIIIKKDLYPLFVDAVKNDNLDELKERIQGLTYLNKISLFSNLIFNQLNIDNIILFEDLDIKIDRPFQAADFERFNIIQQTFGDMMCISIGDRNYTFIYEPSKKTFIQAYIEYYNDVSKTIPLLENYLKSISEKNNIYQAWNELHHFFLSPPSYVDFIMAINKTRPQLLGIDYGLDNEKLKSRCYTALSLNMPIIDVIQNKHLQDEIRISNICFE